MAKRVHILPLTSLRLFFALAVFFHHCFFMTKVNDPLLDGLYARIFSEGYIGVSFFFILSGFILAYNYQSVFEEGKIRKRTFYLARLARIYPLHLVTLLLALPVTTGGISALVSGATVPAFLSHLTLTHALWLDPDIYRAYNSSSWSISTEWFFYLAFPFLILWFGRLLKRMGKTAFLFGLLVLLVPVAFYLVPTELHHALFYISPYSRIADFFLGILLYHGYAMAVSGGRPALNYTWLEAGALLLLGVFFINFSNIPQVWRYSVYYWLPMSAVIWAFALQGGWFSRLLSARWLVVGGEISFALYMIHRPLMRYYQKFKSWVFDPHNAYVDIVVLLCASLIVSYLLHYYVERPVARWVKQRGQPVTPLAP